ncbi:Pectinesterase domain-containing protein/PMEI domain-containing protein [Cephalotus follicularis]|uniref:Pectinesterase n=1 Tax=Cephalotus follicularis TaxID=3775 RepID=A0A1Q3BT61_CEPFO|nr:Pectinesterase domain-containing protein/PMEI domain-containing protein [Cephalotus follicularis]
MVLLVIFLTITTLILASFFMGSSLYLKKELTLTKTAISPPHSIIKNACSRTHYPSLCFTTLTSVPISKSSITFHHFLETAINQTVKSVATTRLNITTNLFALQDLNLQEKNALEDCMEMLDQTLYELGQAIEDLHHFPASMVAYPEGSFGNLKTLLSAAMTNENTCIDGIYEMQEADLDSQNFLKEHLQELLTPISRMISNCLAMIKFMETINRDKTPHVHQQTPITKNPKKGFLSWMTTNDRNLIHKEPNVKPDIIVASDGSRDYRVIEEAVKMAPNNSMNRFVIKIKAGVYNESVVIPREKTNIMFLGDGMNSTLITGTKNLADGFSTFNSATLTIVGDKFLARDLTISNTAGPKKFQAVAARVTSNAAFYRCNFSSYQDTLYAHSLRQFYHECIIQGTIDFIFGNAAAVFQNCVILVHKPNPTQKNMITAQARGDPNQNTGISLQNCTIMASTDLNATDRHNFSTFLGRPWRNYSRTMVMRSYLGDLIHPQGWCKWNQYSNLNTVEYIEYLNCGPGSDTRHRVTWPGYRKNCSEDVAKQFTVDAFLHEADNWLGSTGWLMR